MMPLTIIMIGTLVAAPLDGAAHLQQAFVLLQRGRLAGAAKALDRTLAEDPQNVQALAAAADLAMQQGRLDEARAYLERLLDLDPNDDEARLLVARVSWLATDTPAAEKQLQQVLQRHPTWLPALQLEQRIQSGSPLEQPSGWRPQGRADLSGIYDTALAIVPGTLADVSEQDGALYRADLALQLEHDVAPLPFAVFARMVASSPVYDQDELNRLAPTWLETGLSAYLPLSGFELGLDARYRELFSSLFEEHLQRTVSPSLWAAYWPGSQHELRWLVGLDANFPDDAFATDDNITYRTSLRDHATWGAADFVVDLTGRWNPTEAPRVADEGATLLRVGFAELGGTGYASYPVWAPLFVVGLFSVTGRDFEDGPRETTYHGLLGARFLLGSLELHAEYAYTRNLSSRAFSFDRHQVSAGVRAYYE